MGNSKCPEAGACFRMHREAGVARGRAIGDQVREVAVGVGRLVGRLHRTLRAIIRALLSTLSEVVALGAFQQRRGRSDSVFAGSLWLLVGSR